MCRRFTVVVLLGPIGILGACKPAESDPWRASVESGWIGADSDVVGSASLPLGVEVRGLSSQQHWDAVYSNRVPELVTWYQEHPALSLSFVTGTGLGSDASVVDVGGGCSRLTDCLLDEGFTNLTVLDLSSVAIGYGRQRLGDRADEVTWIEGDVLRHRFDTTFDVWHDRAVFHFLVDPADQDRYVERLSASIPIGGHIVIATFALDGPDKCSGLPVQRYGPKALSGTLGHEFEAVGFQHETHHTPTGATQQFLYGHFQRRIEHTP